MTEMRKIESPVRRVLIAGGGHIGVRLASALEKTNQVNFSVLIKIKVFQLFQKVQWSQMD